MKIHLVPHQHFDLIWRRPVRWYRERRATIFRQALELLEKYDNFTFSFSQTLPLKEFLEEAPSQKSTVSELISRGRLEWIGGTLSIPDLNWISPAALIENIQAGRRYLQENFDYTIRVGAFEDAFGVPAQLPQILTRSNYEFYKAGRMPRFGGAEPSGAFLWEAQDGTRIRCGTNTPDGMSWGWGHPNNPDEPPASTKERRIQLENELRAAIRGALRHGAEHALVTCMGEEHDIFPGIVELVHELQQEFSGDGVEIQFSTHEAYFRSITDWEKQPLYGRTEDFSRLFTGCYTSRIDSKRHPRKLENTLLLNRFAAAPIPEHVNETLALLEFHDAACGCHINENAEFLAARYTEAVAAQKNAPRHLPWQPLFPTFSSGELASPRPASETIAFGRWFIRLDSGNGAVDEMTFDGNAVPVPRIMAREENGTLWTEEYPGKERILSGGGSTPLVAENEDELHLRTEFFTNDFRAFWPGFSRLRCVMTLKFRRESPWIGITLENDFLGNSTELAIRLALPGEEFRTGHAEIPFGSVERGEYPREMMRAELFPALNFVTFGNFIWLNAGTPAHAFRNGGMENLFLRSPVKRWAPWFPVTPEDSMWDNGRRRYDFALCADASRYTAGDIHRLGVEFQLAACGITYETHIPEALRDLPADLVPAGVDEENYCWVFEAAGRPGYWPSQHLAFAPRQIQKVKLP